MCTKFCDEKTKREVEIEWNQRGIKKKTYRLAMFTLKPISNYEAVEVFINPVDSFKPEVSVKKWDLSSGFRFSGFKWGKCGESIFLVKDSFKNEVPIRSFCELYYHDGGQISNEHVKQFP